MKPESGAGREGCRTQCRPAPRQEQRPAPRFRIVPKPSKALALAAKSPSPAATSATFPIMTDELSPDMEETVLSSAPTVVGHALSIRGGLSERFASCFCQEWRFTLADKSVEDVLAAYAAHTSGAQRTSPETGHTQAGSGARAAAWQPGSLARNTANSTAAQARELVARLFWGGLCLAIVGTVIAIPTVGTPLAPLLLVVAGVGEAMLFVALLAWGVRLGFESSHREG